MSDTPETPAIAPVFPTPPLPQLEIGVATLVITPLDGRPVITVTSAPVVRPED